MIASPETLAGEPGASLTEPEQLPPPAEQQTGRTNQDSPDEKLHLLGRPTLKRFLRFARSHAVKPPDEGTLIDEWEAAYDFIRKLEKEEAGAADNPGITKLEVDAKNEALLTEFLKDPLVQNGFNTLPSEVAFVELDRLVVYQHHIDLTYARLLERELGPSPDEEQIFRTALMHDHPRPEVKWSRAHGNRFVFMSPSNDMRFLGAMSLKAGNITDYAHPGDLAGVIGLAVGFGSNFLNAIYAENRLILTNGSHRAYALRKLGITHVPCIVQHVSLREKLEVAADSEVCDHPDYYLKNARPSMFKDYFNPKLYKVMPVHRQLRQVSIKFEVDEANVPAL
jgi:hypothetical protein